MRRLVYLTCFLSLIAILSSCDDKNKTYSFKVKTCFLGLDPLKKPSSSENFYIRISCATSFHADFAITLKDVKDKMLIDIVRQNITKIDVNEETVEPTMFYFTLIHDRGVVMEPAAENLREILKDINISTMKDSSLDGLDGMTVACEYRGQKEQSDFSFWSPEPESKESILLDAIVDCCYNSSLSSDAKNCVEAAEGYF